MLVSTIVCGEAPNRTRPGVMTCSGPQPGAGCGVCLASPTEWSLLPSYLFCVHRDADPIEVVAEGYEHEGTTVLFLGTTQFGVHFIDEPVALRSRIFGEVTEQSN